MSMFAEESNTNFETMTETKVLWLLLNVLWLCKDNSIGHSERKRITINKWTASSTRVAGDRTRWKGVVVKSSAVA